MDPSHLTQFLILSLLLYGSPGPATLSLAASGAAVGFSRSLPYLLGILLGLGLNILLAAFGLVSLLERAPGVVSALRYLSLVYIVYLAIRMLRNKPGPGTRDHSLKFGEGVLINLLNPKGYAANLALMSQFGSAESSQIWFLLSLLLAIGLFVDLAWCSMGVALRHSMIWERKSGVIQIVFAVLLVSSVLIATFWS